MMKKTFLLKSMLLLCALVAGSGMTWGNNNVNTVSTKFSATGNVTSNFTQTGDYASTTWNLAVTWKTNAAWQNLDGTKGSQIGTASNPATSIVLTGSNIPGIITSVVVNTSGASSVNATVAVSVGGTGFSCGGNSTASLTSSAANYTFTGSSSGDVVLTWTNSSDKAIYIKSITITYTPGGSTPSISLNSNTFNHTKGEVDDGSITVTYNNISSVNAEVKYFEADGTTPAASDPDWIAAVINGANNVEYIIEANAGSKRMAYLKVHEKSEDVYSALITITQASGIDTPTFNPTTGTYTTPQNVAISCATDGSTIYYTIDGTDPTNESTEYASPVSITNSGTVLKAIAYKSGGYSEIASATYTIRPEAPTFDPIPGSYVPGTSFTLTSAGNTIYYTLTTDDSEPSTPSSSSTPYTSPIVVSSGTVKIKAVAYDAYNNKGTVASRTYYGMEPTTLPFSWTGTSSAGKDALDAETGVAVNLGGDYAESNAPYRLKFDGVGKYVEVFTKTKPGVVSFTTKIFAAATSSIIKVQGSVDGVSFDDINEFTISGKANDVATHTTTNAFSADHRVVRIYMSNKDQNVGVGSINIAIPEPAAGSDDGAGHLVLTTSANMDGWRAFYHATQDYSVDGNTTIYVAKKSATENVVELTAVGATKIPQGEAVILKTTDAGYSMTLTETTGATTLGDNVLAVTDGTSDVDGYRLGYGEIGGNDKVGFFKYVAAAPAAGIVYIDKSNVNISAGAHGLAISFADDDVTSIKTINADLQKVAPRKVMKDGRIVIESAKGIFTLSGIRMK